MITKTLEKIFFENFFQKKKNLLCSFPAIFETKFRRK